LLLQIANIDWIFLQVAIRDEGDHLIVLMHPVSLCPYRRVLISLSPCIAVLMGVTWTANWEPNPPKPTLWPRYLVLQFL
jgi:hypothetical protein